MDNRPKQFLKIEQVMELLQCSKTTIYRMVADRQLQAAKVRGLLRITLESVLRYQERIISEFNESENLL